MTREDIVNEVVSQYDVYLPRAIQDELRTRVLSAMLNENEWCAKISDVEHEDVGDSIDDVLTRVSAAIRSRK